MDDPKSKHRNEHRVGKKPIQIFLKPPELELVDRVKSLSRARSYRKMLLFLCTHFEESKK